MGKGVNNPFLPRGLDQCYLAPDDKYTSAFFYPCRVLRANIRVGRFPKILCNLYKTYVNKKNAKKKVQ